jgi:protein-disulfide isomerase
VTALLTLAALAIAVSAVRREFFPTASAQRVAAESGPTFVDGWEKLTSVGIHTGARDAPIKIIEFTDLECPFCRVFHHSLRAIGDKYGATVAHVFIHYPIATHRFARPAARAAECANDQGRFSSFIDVVFNKQDSLGLKTWTSYAQEAGLLDTVRFVSCIAHTATIPRIESGRLVGEQVGVQGTPTVIVNGWRLPGTPSDSQLVRVIEDILAGKKPTTTASPDLYRGLESGSRLRTR